MSKHLHFLIYPVFAYSALTFCNAMASENNTEKQETAERIKSKGNYKTTEGSEEKLISFRFNQASLFEIIDMLAKEKELNIVIPAGQQSITEKITFSMAKKITIEEAWQRLLTFLRICGYSVIIQREFVSIIKNDPKEISRQSLPLYVHTSTELLPDCDERIRYLYYFYNVQLGGVDGGGSIIDILQSFLSKDATILIDEGVNGVIITDTARHIESAITLLKELDVQQDASDSREILPLKHTVATTIAGYLQAIINPTGKQSLSDIGAPSQSPYFSKNIRIVAEPRTNALILLGKKEPLARIKTFIQEFIDIKLDTGDSILHIYDLQYLDAPTFRQTLTSILSSQSAGSTYGGQSSGSSQETAGKQYFKDVKIISESAESVNPASLSDTSGVSIGNQSGNRLIIAAKRDDWLRIEKLIKDLDKPQLQVAIEVLIVDLNISENKALGSQLRNLGNLNLKDVNFATSHLGGDGGQNGAIIQKNGTSTSADLMQADMLSATGSDALGNQENIASKLTAGSFVVSFKDPVTNGMWLITQMLNSYTDTKILSQPFIVALNNQPCIFDSSETRLLAGGSSVIPGGGGVQSYQDSVRATLTVKITPMIGRDSDNIKITLAINIDIQEYQGSSTEILKRLIQTNVTITDGDILILGGLTKTQITKSENKTPLLSKIPIIGNLFKSKANSKTKDNLLVFISPRIIMPRQGLRFDPFTASKINNVNYLFNDSKANGNDFKDPITHWFFGSDDDEIAIRKVKSLGNKNLFHSIDKEDEHKARAHTIYVDKNEKIPDNVIKKTENLLPSPDKTPTGATKLVVKKPGNKENTPREVQAQGTAGNLQKNIAVTPTGAPKVTVAKQTDKLHQIKNQQPTMKPEAPKNKTVRPVIIKDLDINEIEAEELKKLSTQLKKPAFV